MGRAKQRALLASLVLTGIALSSLSSSTPLITSASAAGLDDVFGEFDPEDTMDDIMVLDESGGDGEALEENAGVGGGQANNAVGGEGSQTERRAPTSTSTTSNESVMGKNLAESLAGLKALFATGIAVSTVCENEQIPPEESCCLPPSSFPSSSATSNRHHEQAFGFDAIMGGGQQQHECFAPPIDDRDHPWDSSPSLVEAMRGAMTEINADEFERMTANINNGADNGQQQKLLVIDTRCAAEFVAGHVPNAVFGGVGTDQFDRFIGTVHSDHNTPVVFIHTPPFVPAVKPQMQRASDEEKSSASPEVVGTVDTASPAEMEEADAANKAAIEEIAQRLVKAGLSNLRGHLQGGMASWIGAAKPIATMERWNASTLVSKLLVDEKRIEVKKNGVNKKSKKTQGEAVAGSGGEENGYHPQSLIDLREPCASDFSSLPNSESIPVSETVLKEVFHRAQHEKNPSHPLVLYCSNGFRSLMVASALKAMKPDINVVCMENGFDDLESMSEIKALMDL